MVMLVIMVVGSTTVLVNSLNAHDLKIARQQQTVAALAQAKDALIGRAISDNNRPGSLPCPDLITNNPAGGNIPNDGVADSLAGNNCPSNIGRLPWKTLKLADARDANGEHLWYALSSNFTDDDSRIINNNTPGQLTVTGSGLGNNVVAVIFSPGGVIEGQQRDNATPSAAINNAVTNFLDGENANGDTTFLTTPASPTFNDQLLTITEDDLIPAVERRVAYEALNCLVKYARDNGGKYPWAAEVKESGQASAQIQPHFLDKASRLFGRMPDDLNNTNSNGLSATWPVGCMFTTRPNSNNSSTFNADAVTLKTNWREFVFYGVAAANSPKPSDNATCTACLTVNTPTATVARQVVVIMAGRTLPDVNVPGNAAIIGTSAGQFRTNADVGLTAKLREEIQNYLEDENGDYDQQNITADNLTYERKPATKTNNDSVFFCRRTIPPSPITHTTADCE